ncbi:MAG: excinuclease ABC subunit UvrC [Candidatus Gygaella obscura]|nr:excinuclease ABC subunit UvrC [Candidatus Gygaella obscura]
MDKKKIKSLPVCPGVYLMKDVKSQIIYIGKAKNLKKRVSQYFRKSSALDFKTAKMVERVRDFDFLVSPTEDQALILEARLIRQHRPYYNIELRDDKSFPFVMITKDRFPRVFIVRPKEKKEAFYYGPFTNVGLLRSVLKQIRRIFSFCTCKNPKTSCLYSKIGLCPGPDIKGKALAGYRRNINNLKLFLEGKNDKLFVSLNQQMLAASKRKNFESAAKIRDQIKSFSNLTQQKDITVLEHLKSVLGLKKIPFRIEAFDISNISGALATGGMVSFLNGLSDKANYRKFRIKSISTIDDYAMLKEVLLRRYRRVLSEALPLPDLIIIDGGKGQLSCAKKVMRELKLDIDLISLAKKEEEIFIPSKKNPIALPFSSDALQFLRRVRDEVHRFAIDYHRLLRKKNLINEKNKRK